MKLMTVLGARPQFIKASAVSREITRVGGIEEILVHTGQHFDARMSAVFFDELDIAQPQFQLGISGLSHGAMTGRMIEALENVMLEQKPDKVLVYGDTNSTLAGAIAASKLCIPLCHVEAGLRSFNMSMPEEVNRIVTDRLSSLLCCPTKTAMENLQKEGYADLDSEFLHSGDVMFDSALHYANSAEAPEVELDGVFTLCTVHRPYNTDFRDRLEQIIGALQEMAKSKQVVIPLHPRTRKYVEDFGLDLSGLTIIEPQGYLQMIYLLKNADMVVTDSGGLQKEAFFFRKPCLVLRSETEWVELTENKFAILVGYSREAILQAYADFRFPDVDALDLYGRGDASQLIVSRLSAG